MTDERWRRVEALYHAALARDEASRTAFLADECAGDDALRHEVESLLGHDAPDDGFLGTPAAAMAPRITADEPPALAGRRLGAYEVQARIGAGGMGEVYRARDTKLG